MSYTALAIVIFSALMHSSYNFLYKKSGIKVIYLWSMFSVSIVLMSAFAFIVKPELIVPTPRILILSASAGIFFTLYQLFTGKAYSLSEGDLSVTYPLSITAPLYIPFLAYIFLGERITLLMFMGILIALVGTYVIQMNTSIRNFSFERIDLRKKHIRYAAFAGFIYSFGAIIDKIGVGRERFFVYTYWVVVFMFIYMTLNILRNRDLKSYMFACYRRSLPVVVLGGIILTLSFLSYRFALTLAYVSAVSGARQISSLFGVLMGIFFLKEPYGPIRIIATMLIVIGIMFIKIG